MKKDKPVHMVTEPTQNFICYPSLRWYRLCRPDDLCWVSIPMPDWLTSDPSKATCKHCRRIIEKGKL
jgi:hypothetical protein